MAFVYDVLAGKATAEDFDRYIAAWDEAAARTGTIGQPATYHQTYLHTGMLWPEYGMYIEDADPSAEEVLDSLVKARRQGLDLWDYFEQIREKDSSAERMWRLCQHHSRQWEEIRNSADPEDKEDREDIRRRRMA